MAIKLTVHDEQIFSQPLLKLLDLKFLFWEISIMSHTHDVINSQLKREFQKRQKMEISRVHGRIQILKERSISSTCNETIAEHTEL